MLNFKKIAALALTTLVLASSMIGCSKTGNTNSNQNGNTVNEAKEYVFKINDKSIGLEEFKYYYTMLKFYYEGDIEKFTEKEEYDKYIGEVLNELKLNESLEILAAKNNVALTDDEYKTQVTDYIQQVKDSYGDSYEQELKNAGLTEEIFENQIRLSAIYQKLFEETTKDGGIFDVNDIEAIKISAIEQNAIRAKHVLIQFGNPEYDTVPEDEEGMTDEQKAAAKEQNEKARTEAVEKDKAEKLATAKEVLEKAKNGEDFDKLIEQYNQDPGMNQYPGGYYFVEGEMVTEFYEGALALEEGGISDIVETSYGYHIIQRLPHEDESLMASSFAQAQIQSLEYDKFMAEIENISQSLNVEYAADFDTKYSYSEMEKLTAPEQAQTESDNSQQEQQQDTAEVAQ